MMNTVIDLLAFMIFILTSGFLLWVQADRALSNRRQRKHLTEAESIRQIAEARQWQRLSEITVITDGMQTAIEDRNPNAQWFFIPNNGVLESGARIGAGNPLSPLSGENLPDVLPAIMPELSIAVIGAQGSGKTTLLNRLLSERLLNGEICIVIDPHGYTGAYPEGVRLFGAYRDYDGIDGAFDELLSEMQRRYQRFPQPSEPLTVFVDEWTLLYKNCVNTQRFIESALTEFRKVSMRIIFNCHSKTAKYLNLKGGYDLTDGVCFVELVNDFGNRYAVVSRGVKDTGKRFSLPYSRDGGDLRIGDHRTAPVFLSAPVQTIETPSKHHSTGDENTGVCTGDHHLKNTGDRIISAFKNGMSRNRICKAFFGSKNPDRMGKINDVLKGAGLI